RTKDGWNLVVGQVDDLAQLIALATVVYRRGLDEYALAANRWLDLYQAAHPIQVTDCAAAHVGVVLHSRLPDRHQPAMRVNCHRLIRCTKAAALVEQRHRQGILPYGSRTPAVFSPKQIHRLLVQRVVIPAGAGGILVAYHGCCSLPASSPVADK